MGRVCGGGAQHWVSAHTNSYFASLLFFSHPFFHFSLSNSHTLLVLTYHNTLPLTRAWCLSEIVTGVGGGEGAFEVIMPPEEVRKQPPNSAPSAAKR